MSLPIPEIGKRPRDDETEALIREALQEEELLKKQKKGEHAAAGTGAAADSGINSSRTGTVVSCAGTIALPEACLLCWLQLLHHLYAVKLVCCTATATAVLMQRQW